VTEKIIFVAQHYFAFVLCVAACWGLGQALIPQAERRTISGVLLGLTAGMGVAICALQALAIMGQMRTPWVLALLAAALLMAGLECARTMPHPMRAFSAWCAAASIHARGSVAVLGLFFLSTLLAPMTPPLGWDEVMYHLPHARAWAASGSMDIHGWLRYPWFPYNLDLPFAAALLLYDDVFAHLLGALPGWVCAGLLFQVAVRFTNIPSASIASILWIQAGRDQYAYACVDLGASLFVFASYAAYLQAQESPHKSRWLAMAAFLLGVACGGKYQTLSFIPLLVLGIWFTDRRPSTIAKTALALLLPCAYWYVRNAVLTGDPFQPMGGKIFGFSDWNLADYQAQFADLKRNAAWPRWYLWPVLLLPLWSRLRQSPLMRTAFCICVYGVAFWLASSHYPRYLLPLYPLLCILSMVVWNILFQGTAHKIAFLHKTRAPQTTMRWWTAALVLCVPVVFANWAKTIDKVSPTQASRDTLLQKKIASYDALTYLNNNPSQKIYQYGIDDAIYYSQAPLYGDGFGPWRFADFADLPPREFARKLASLGFDRLIINSLPNPALEKQADFSKYFSPLFSRDDVTVYRVQADATQP
jgi:hypothetical protein